MIFVLSCTYAAWATDAHFISSSDHVASQVDGGSPGDNAALDPDHCSHEVSHLLGTVASRDLTVRGAVHVPVSRESGFTSFLGSPPSDPPRV